MATREQQINKSQKGWSSDSKGRWNLELVLDIRSLLWGKHGRMKDIYLPKGNWFFGGFF